VNFSKDFMARNAKAVVGLLALLGVNFMTHGFQLTGTFLSSEFFYLLFAIFVLVSINKKCPKYGVVKGPKRHCDHCGWYRYCPSCGADTKPPYLFCPNCGEKPGEASEKVPTQSDKNNQTYLWFFTKPKVPCPRRSKSVTVGGPKV
jgi:hypothetical protein